MRVFLFTLSTILVACGPTYKCQLACRLVDVVPVLQNALQRIIDLNVYALAIGRWHELKFLNDVYELFGRIGIAVDITAADQLRNYCLFNLFVYSENVFAKTKILYRAC